MRILVTGGAGFIGSHLSERLVREGHQVSILDDLNDFYPPAVKRANLAAVESVGPEGTPGPTRSLSVAAPVAFHQGDIRSAETVETVFAAARPEIVFHLAARAGVRGSLEQPVLYEETNVRGTLLLVEAARRHGISKFLFASSSSIYGIANRVPFSEEDSLNLPISPYAATKIAGEKLCYTWSHLYGLPVTCLRFFTVYGPRQRPDLAIHKFTRLMEAGQPIPFFGDGSTGRDYTFIDDIVDGLMAALGYECRYEILNLGNSHPVLLAELVATLEAALGKKAILDRQPDQPGDVPLTYADISKAGRLLGYKPRTPFAEGIAKFVEWYRAQRAPQRAPLAVSGP
jgi:UDP-glucuronate 4-epimerase